MCNTIVEGYQPPAPPARQPLPMTAREWIETCCLNCQNPSCKPKFIYAFMYRICTKYTLCISKKLEVMSKNGFQI